jgi:hypothetical protein
MGASPAARDENGSNARGIFGAEGRLLRTVSAFEEPSPWPSYKGVRRDAVWRSRVEWRLGGLGWRILA